jgi:hypothetical protein
MATFGLAPALRKNLRLGGISPLAYYVEKLFLVKKFNNTGSWVTYTTKLLRQFLTL